MVYPIHKATNYYQTKPVLLINKAPDELENFKRACDFRNN